MSLTTRLARLRDERNRAARSKVVEMVKANILTPLDAPRLEQLERLSRTVGVGLGTIAMLELHGDTVMKPTLYAAYEVSEAQAAIDNFIAGRDPADHK